MSKTFKRIEEIPDELWFNDRISFSEYPCCTDDIDGLVNVEDQDGYLSREQLIAFLKVGYTVKVCEETRYWLSNFVGAGCSEEDDNSCGACIGARECGPCIRLSTTETVVKLGIKLQTWQKLCGHPISPE